MGAFCTLGGPEVSGEPTLKLFQIKNSHGIWEFICTQGGNRTHTSEETGF